MEGVGDAHRKRQQAAHPDLTLTDLYNAVEAVRAGRPLTAKERKAHDAGLATALIRIHDDLDAAVAEAYGWPANLTEQETLARLVALNAERADEERRGIVRWLRPEFQAPGATGGAVMEQEDFAGEGSQAPADEATIPAGKAKPGPGGRRDPARDLQIRLADWPATLAEQAIAVRSALSDATGPATPADLARAFAKVRAPKVEAILRTLTALGQARRTDAGGYVATA